MDRLILQRVCELQAKGEPFALITILSTKGSTPRKAGAVMLMERIGRTVGTIGGGCGEAEVKQRALLAMDEQTSCIHRVNMVNDVAAEEGMVCGGSMEVFIQVFAGFPCQ
ncbi:predicted sulfurylase small subunit, molybdopterin cytosine dinucleotide biosynthesis [Desulforamulus reducens MI-1]|uniref:Predicted sulfurylase small subunit, molybdopterin cytosine dinucleotide biosynthesis n=1 Tax=Desulforamulus reducens (strain ATCC BAA-1160 / DSM 100696 / MI-1) TaxID=349161 RepID=A4J1B1_DESRM|nr:XdhC family protein [Desulforamulus reducens]ABO48864.1 predicted sulfurylase small subunit, molybdopterin cytosine dinucleotide biosynthesis [Desulforamulus reducens MI-1]